MKKLEIEETKTTYYSTFKTDIIKVGLVFSISNFFIKKSSLANKWMSFSYSNLALRIVLNFVAHESPCHTFILNSKKVPFKKLVWGIGDL